MFHEWSLIHLFRFWFSAVTSYPVFVQYVFSCNVVLLKEVTDHYIKSTFFFLSVVIIWAVSCCRKWPIEFLIMWLHIMTKHTIATQQITKMCIISKKKKKCTVNRGELPLRALFNRVASESLSWGESLISRQVLF